MTLTRTDRGSGAVRVQEAVIVAGPAGGVVVRTPEGVEALGCSGLADHLRYPAIPTGLTAGPVLSVETVSRSATTAMVTLSYLTSEFDWAASYVASLTADGRHLDLFAWLTLANGNAQRFAAAQVQAVAARLNRDDRRDRPTVAPLRLDCHRLGTTTSDLPPPDSGRDRRGEDIVVTGSRRVMRAMDSASPVTVIGGAALEELGDLKLYRVPERLTVNPSAQKQVALLARRNVPFTRIYRLTLSPAQPVPLASTAVALRLENRVTAGLGLPLPAGSTTLYGLARGEQLLMGTGRIDDKAVGERVRIGAGTSTQVQVAQTVPERGHGRIEITNANPFAVAIEIAVAAPVGNVAPGSGLVELGGRPTWVATIAANSRAALTYIHRPGGG